MERIVQGLVNLGLNRKEAQVYFALLQLGQSSAQEVARKAELKRPTVYLILGDLMKKGLVMKIPKLRKQMFVAKEPWELLSTAEEKLAQARNVLPLLEAASNDGKKVRTLYFEGIQGIKEALYYRLDELKGKEIRGFFGSGEDASEELTALFHKWNEDVYKNGTKVISIAPDHKSLEEFRKNDKVFEFFPKVIPQKFYTSKSSIDVTPFFVRILMFKEHEAVIIENPAVAKAMLEIFEMVYSKY